MNANSGEPPPPAARTDAIHALNQPLGAICNYAEACRLLLGRPGSEARITDTLAAIIEQARRASGLLYVWHEAAGETGRDGDAAGAAERADALVALLAAFGCALPLATASDWPAAAAAGLLAELPGLAARLAAVAAQRCIVTATAGEDAVCTLTLASAAPMQATLAQQCALLDATAAACSARLQRCGIRLNPRFLPGHGLVFELHLPQGR